MASFTVKLAFAGLVVAGLTSPAAAFHPNDYTPRYYPYYGQIHRTYTYQPKYFHHPVDYVYYKPWKKKRHRYHHLH